MQTGGLQFAKSTKHGADLAAEMEQRDVVSGTWQRNQTISAYCMK